MSIRVPARSKSYFRDGLSSELGSSLSSNCFLELQLSQPALVERVREGLTAVARGVVVVYFSWFGKPLQQHHKVVLDADSKAIADIRVTTLGDATRGHTTMPALSFSCLTTPCSQPRHHASGFIPRSISTAVLSPISL